MDSHIVFVKCLFKDSGVSFWWVFGEKSSNFVSEAFGNFDGIVCWLFNEEDQDLEHNNFMHKRLVDKMGEEGGSGMADDLITKKMFK